MHAPSSTDATTSTHAPGRSVAAAVLALVLVACGAPDVGATADPDSPAPEGSAAAAGAPASPAPDAPPDVPPAATAQRVGASTPERPVAITLPDGTSMPVQEADTTVDGLLDVPPDVRVAGWWPGGSRLGDPFGSTLVAAHVDSDAQGLGPFASLLQARAGDRVRLRSRGLQQVFAVTSTELVPRSSFASRPGLHAPTGVRRLVLVTCAPPYDVARGGYQNLAVVIAEPTSQPSERGAR